MKKEKHHRVNSGYMKGDFKKPVSRNHSPTTKAIQQALRRDSDMKRCLVSICLILLVAASLPGYCTIPSFRGYTGLFVVPTADALGKGDWNAGVFCEDVSSETINDYVGNYGIAQGFEVGLDRFRRNDNSENHTLINAKYKFMPETVSRPAIAAGLIDITNEIETSAYVVASKSLGCSIRAWKGETLSPRIHFGVGAGELSGIFVGASAYLGNRFQVLGEWDSNTVQAGFRFRITPVFTLHAGGFNLADKHNSQFINHSSYAVGLSFNSTY